MTEVSKEHDVNVVELPTERQHTKEHNHLTLQDEPIITFEDVDQEEDGVSGSESEDSDIVREVFENELDRAELEPYVEDGTSVGLSDDEAKRLRTLLRSVGQDQFIQQTLSSGQYSVRTLVTAFGGRPDLPFPEEWYDRMLELLIHRELKRRQKLSQYNTIDDAVELLKWSSNIIVITGAGISTSLGIPDFRSKNTGFYSKLIARGYDSPEDVFDIENFDADPTVFYHLAKEILPVTDRCSPTHTFIKTLQDQGKLLTNYTQNIDNIEAFAGISSNKLVQCHGSWATASCRKCRAAVPGESIFEDVRTQQVARCKVCSTSLNAQPSRKRKRGSGSNSRSHSKSAHSDDDSDGQYDIFEPGVMKPNIIFFGEQLPNTFFDRLTEEDKDVVDLVIVIGTSMKVAPVSEIPNYLAGDVPQIYISREPADHINWDISLLGYCDDVVSELCRRAGWTLKHDLVNPDAAAVVEAHGDSGYQWRISMPGKTQSSIQKPASTEAVPEHSPA